MYITHVPAKGSLLSWLFVLGALAGCGGGAGGQGGITTALGASVGPPVPAPTLAVGDHWQYRITDNLRRGTVTMLDAQVVSLANGVATLRLVYSDQPGYGETTEEIDANGALLVGALKPEPARRFPTPIELYDFPLQAGTSWR